MKITARLSQFDKEFRPVENPIAVISEARKRLGKPFIRFFRGAKVYDFLHGGFDKLTIVIDRAERHGYN